MANMQYSPAIFEQPDLAAAAGIILTPEAGLTTDQRWARETPYLADLIINDLGLDHIDGDDHVPAIIDYGCGIGRLASPLLDAGASVIGVEISQSMREQARQYLGGSAGEFSILDPRFFSECAREGRIEANGAIAIWSLQHVLDVKQAINDIYSVLKPGSLFVVVNSNTRAVPTDAGWINDGVSVINELNAKFTPLFGRKLNPAKMGDAVAGSSFYGVFKR